MVIVLTRKVSDLMLSRQQLEHPKVQFLREPRLRQISSMTISLFIQEFMRKVDLILVAEQEQSLISAKLSTDLRLMLEG